MESSPGGRHVARFTRWFVLLVGCNTAALRADLPDERVQVAVGPRTAGEDDLGRQAERIGVRVGGLFGDFDYDGDVDLRDFIGFQICMSVFPPPEVFPPACRVFDFDDDDDVDLVDLREFFIAHTGSFGRLTVDAGNSFRTNTWWTNRSRAFWMPTCFPPPENGNWNGA